MTDTPAALKGAFDPAKLEEARVALGNLRTEVDDSAKRLDEMFQRTQGDDGTGFTAEDQANYNNMAIAHKALEGRHARMESQVQTMEMRDPAKAVERDENKTDSSELLDKYLRATSDAEAAQMLQSDEFSDFRTGSIPGGSIPADTFNVASMTANAVRSDNASGENAVDQTTYRGIIDRLLEYGGVQQMAYAFSTNTGEKFIVPRADNTSQKGRIIGAQGSNVNTVPPANIGSAEIGAETLTSDRVPVTNEMIQDSVFDIVGWVERSLVRRIGRIKNEVMTKTPTSPANNDFKGVASVAAAGITSAGENAITYGELVDLIYEVDPAYRMGGESGLGGFSKPGMGATGFMMHESVEQVLMKLVDSEGRPLWNVSTRTGVPNMIVGQPYVVNQDLDAMGTTGNVPLLYGCFEYFWVRNITGLSIHNFWDSNTANANERHIYGFHRCSSEYVGPVDSSGDADAIKKLTLG